ncbi:MAG: hypothetical protein KDK45_01490 [Leptospiraceae bacterium]|nr:hypothetical protein [Leptospiraceae bacterium]
MADDNERKTIIGRKFFQYVKDIYNYIKKDSLQNADKFADGILPAIEKVEKHPRSFPLIKAEGFEDEKIEYRYYHYMKSFKIIYKLPKGLLVFLGRIHDKQSDLAIQELKKENSELDA